jgi:hypothetical protein
MEERVPSAETEGIETIGVTGGSDLIGAIDPAEARNNATPHWHRQPH